MYYNWTAHTSELAGCQWSLTSNKYVLVVIQYVQLKIMFSDDYELAGSRWSFSVNKYVLVVFYRFPRCAVENDDLLLGTVNPIIDCPHKFIITVTISYYAL